MYKLYSNIICSIAFSYFCSDIVHGSSQEMVVFSGVTNFDQMIERENAAKVLDISVNATDDEIKKAYRTLSVKYHTDKGGDIEKFQKLKVAYDVMCFKNSDDNELQSIKSKIQKVNYQSYIELCKVCTKVPGDEFDLHLQSDQLLIDSPSDLENATEILNLCEKKLCFLQSKNSKQEFFNKMFGMDKYPVIKKEINKLFQISYSLKDDYEAKNKQLEEVVHKAEQIAVQIKLHLLAESYQELPWHRKLVIFDKFDEKYKPDSVVRQIFCNSNFGKFSVARQIFCNSNKKKKEKIDHVELDKKIQDINNQDLVFNPRLGSIATVGAVSSLGLVATGIMLRYKNS